MRSRAQRNAGGFVALLDHQARVWRRSEIVGALREAIRTYEVVVEPTTANATLRRPRTRLGEGAPGLTPLGEARVYMPFGTDVRPTDVIELVDGPQAPGTFEVDARIVGPRGHHIEIDCRNFHGTLPEVGS